MSDLRAQNLALYAVLYGIKSTSIRFSIPKSLLTEAVSDLLDTSSHPFFSALRCDLREKVLELGVQTFAQKYHFSTMLAELLALTKEADQERATDCTTSPMDSAKRNLMKEFDSPQVEPIKPIDLPVTVTEDALLPRSLSSEEELINMRKRSYKYRLNKAVEWYKQGQTAELVADKLNIGNKYKIHMLGNWSQLPKEKIGELGKVQYSIKQLCGKSYSLKQVEKVFESQPHDLIKVLYQVASSTSTTKKRKLSDQPDSPAANVGT
jgi:hypothetical protein